MSQTAALFLGLDGSAWLAGRHVHLPDDVVTLLQAAAAERDELLAEAREGRGVLHTDKPVLHTDKPVLHTDKPRQPPADGALMLYDRSQSRFFRSKDGLAWDVDVHNPIVATGATLNCYYSVESEPRADGTRMHRRTYWLKDGTCRGIALVQYRLLHEHQTRRTTKRPRGVTKHRAAEANAAFVAAVVAAAAAPAAAVDPALAAAAAGPRPTYPWDASLDASLGRLHEMLQHLVHSHWAAPPHWAAPLLHLNNIVKHVQSRVRV
jgi:hypothetical protein